MTSCLSEPSSYTPRTLRHNFQNISADIPNSAPRFWDQNLLTKLYIYIYTTTKIEAQHEKLRLKIDYLYLQDLFKNSSFWGYGSEFRRLFREGPWERAEKRLGVQAKYRTYSVAVGQVNSIYANNRARRGILLLKHL